jgi:EAL and modified HD-GYP domain-containing signal transduction protein
LYIARQAIFNRSLQVFGYELLFRGDKQSFQYDGLTSAQASASVLGGLFELGIGQIVDNKPAFINFDAELILSDSIELIDSKQLIIEVLEDVGVDDELIRRVELLKLKGYKIALDDFDSLCSTYPLVPYADIIKYDLIRTPLDQISEDVKKALSNKKILLAEKIENEEEFKKAKKMGFHLFQGFFFSKPHLVAESKSHTTVKSQYLRIISELQKQEPSYQILAEIIEKDANLAYRLVKVASMRSGKDMIYSIRHALAYMGLKEIERWISILMLREVNNSKPDELMRISLIRTKFSEQIAVRSSLRKRKIEASIMGLFSTIDAMTNQTMADALQDIALPSVIKDVLINKTGELFPVYQLILAYEKGDWATAEKTSGMIGIHEKDMCDDYLKALKWAKDIMEAINN